MRITRSAVVALAPVALVVAPVATVVLFLADWPNRPILQLLLGIVLGVAGWLVAAAVVGPDVVTVGRTGSDTYEELVGRVHALKARTRYLTERKPHGAAAPGAEEALAQARMLVSRLTRELALDGEPQHGSPYRWLLGHGYVNAWRDVHRVEDLLLAAEPREVVYATALTNLDRLTPARRSQRTPLVDELKHLVDDRRRHDATLAEVDQPWARALVRESAYRIHKTQNDAWDQIVNLRNRLFATVVVASLVLYGVLALVVLQPADHSVVTAGVAFFLAGASVGVFNELYLASRRRKGTVFDYGLAQVRLLATPILSGIAGLAGVLVTNLAGTFVVVGAGEDGTAVPGLGEIFSLDSYAMGLVVAAIFGLAPGLLLARLRERTDDYKSEIEKVAPSEPAAARVNADDLASSA